MFKPAKNGLPSRKYRLNYAKTCMETGKNTPVSTQHTFKTDSALDDREKGNRNRHSFVPGRRGSHFSPSCDLQRGYIGKLIPRGCFTHLFDEIILVKWMCAEFVGKELQHAGRPGHVYGIHAANSQLTLDAPWPVSREHPRRLIKISEKCNFHSFRAAVACAPHTNRVVLLLIVRVVSCTTWRERSILTTEEAPPATLKTTNSRTASSSNT